MSKYATMSRKGHCCTLVLSMLVNPTVSPHSSLHTSSRKWMLLTDSLTAPAAIGHIIIIATPRVEQTNFPVNGTGPGRHSGDAVERDQGARQRGVKGRHGEKVGGGRRVMGGGHRDDVAHGLVSRTPFPET